MSEKKPLVDRILKPVLIVCAAIIIIAICIFVIGSNVLDARTENLITSDDPAEQAAGIIIKLAPQTMEVSSISVRDGKAEIIMDTKAYDPKSFVDRCSAFALDFVEMSMENKVADEITIKFETSFIDPRGNDVRETGMSCHFTKDGVKGVNFSNFKDMVWKDYRKLSNISDVIIHPSIVDAIA